jgi:hypothetical protein
MYLTKNIKEKCVMARVMRQKKKHQRNFTLKEHGTWKKAARAILALLASTGLPES